MRKILITVIVVILVAILGWYFFMRGSSTPIAQTINNILPFGQTPADSGQGGVGGSNSVASFGTTTPEGTSPPTSRLFQISNEPVAGATAFIKNGVLLVRYAERATGHIYDVDPATLKKTQIINITVPKIYNASFTPDGSKVAFQTLPNDGDSIQTMMYTLIAPASTSTDGLYKETSVVLPPNINVLAVASTSLAYTQKNSPNVTRANLDGTKPTIMFSNSFNQWRLSMGVNAILLTAKASASTPGYSYTVSTPGVLSKILGPLNGLVALPNANLTRVAYSTSGNGNTLIALDTAKGATEQLSPATLAEKCTWSEHEKQSLYCGAPRDGLGAGEPDLWYRGAAHFSDRLWKFNADSGAATELVDPTTITGADIDVVSPLLAPDDSYLFFMNRTDLSLWALKL